MGLVCKFDVVTMVYGVKNNLQIFDFFKFCTHYYFYIMKI